MQSRDRVIDHLLRQARFLAAYKRMQLSSQIRRTVSNQVFQRQVRSFEREVSKEVAEHFKLSLKSAITGLNNLGGDYVPQDASVLVELVYDATEWKEDLINRVLPIMARGMSEAAAAFFLVLGIDPRRKKKVRQKASTATEWLNTMGLSPPPGIATDLPGWMQEEISGLLQETFQQDYWEDIDATTADDLQLFLEEGINNGWSIDKMTDEMGERFDDYSDARATRVARTEAGNALNGARDASLERMKEELPDEVSQYISKSWLAVLDSRTRDAHADLDGELADEDGMFDLNGTRVPWPGHYSLDAGDRINCRCTISTEFGVGADLEEIENMLADED